MRSGLPSPNDDDMRALFSDVGDEDVDMGMSVSASSSSSASAVSTGVSQGGAPPPSGAASNFQAKGPFADATKQFPSGQFALPPAASAATAQGASVALVPRQPASSAAAKQPEWLGLTAPVAADDHAKGRGVLLSVGGYVCMHWSRTELHRLVTQAFRDWGTAPPVLGQGPAPLTDPVTQLNTDVIVAFEKGSSRPPQIHVLCSQGGGGLSASQAQTVFAAQEILLQQRALGDVEREPAAADDTAWILRHRDPSLGGATKKSHDPYIALAPAPAPQRLLPALADWSPQENTAWARQKHDKDRGFTEQPRHVAGNPKRPLTEYFLLRDSFFGGGQGAAGGAGDADESANADDSSYHRDRAAHLRSLEPDRLALGQSAANQRHWEQLKRRQRNLRSQGKELRGPGAIVCNDAGTTYVADRKPTGASAKHKGLESVVHEWGRGVGGAAREQNARAASGALRSADSHPPIITDHRFGTSVLANATALAYTAPATHAHVFYALPHKASPLAKKDEGRIAAAIRERALGLHTSVNCRIHSNTQVAPGYLLRSGEASGLGAAKGAAGRDPAPYQSKDWTETMAEQQAAGTFATEAGKLEDRVARGLTKKRVPHSDLLNWVAAWVERETAADEEDAHKNTYTQDAPATVKMSLHDRLLGHLRLGGVPAVISSSVLKGDLGRPVLQAAKELVESKLRQEKFVHSPLTTVFRHGLPASQKCTCDRPGTATTPSTTAETILQQALLNDLAPLELLAAVTWVLLLPRGRMNRDANGRVRSRTLWVCGPPSSGKGWSTEVLLSRMLGHGAIFTPQQAGVAPWRAFAAGTHILCMCDEAQGLSRLAQWMSPGRPALEGWAIVKPWLSGNQTSLTLPATGGGGPSELRFVGSTHPGVIINGPTSGMDPTGCYVVRKPVGKGKEAAKEAAAETAKNREAEVSQAQDRIHQIELRHRFGQVTKPTVCRNCCALCWALICDTEAQTAEEQDYGAQIKVSRPSMANLHAETQAVARDLHQTEAYKNTLAAASCFWRDHKQKRQAEQPEQQLAPQRDTAGPQQATDQLAKIQAMLAQVLASQGAGGGASSSASTL